LNIRRLVVHRAGPVDHSRPQEDPSTRSISTSCKLDSGEKIIKHVGTHRCSAKFEA
jgi:hypothetical protein